MKEKSALWVSKSQALWSPIPEVVTKKKMDSQQLKEMTNFMLLQLCNEVIQFSCE